MRERIGKLKLKLKNQKGFTLIELMAVLAILAIIVAIAVPAVGSIMDKAKDSAAKSNVELVENAAEIAKISTSGTAEADSIVYKAVDLEKAGYLKVEPAAAAAFDAEYTLVEEGNSGRYEAKTAAEIAEDAE